MDLGVNRVREPDRNHDKGGRSFYFFDFDDNIAFLETPIYLFHKRTGKPMELSSGQYALFKKQIGESGDLVDYELKFHSRGSYQRFRDKKVPLVNRITGQQQSFVEDVKQALSKDDFQWQGPSWSCFYHAVFNQRNVSVITARGHEPETIKKGIKEFVKLGHLPSEPNYLDIYPVNNPKTQTELGFEVGEGQDVAKLKQEAIRRSVERAFELYGENPYHRFGMSDDDPRNLELICEEMARLKKDYPKNSFFVISTFRGELIKQEIFSDHSVRKVITSDAETQLSLL